MATKIILVQLIPTDDPDDPYPNRFYYGPFDGFDEASAYADANLRGTYYHGDTINVP